MQLIVGKRRSFLSRAQGGPQVVTGRVDRKEARRRGMVYKGRSCFFRFISNSWKSRGGVEFKCGKIS